LKLNIKHIFFLFLISVCELFSATVSHAMPLADRIYMIISVQRGKALQVKDSSMENLANIEIFKPHGSANQNWIFKPCPIKDGVTAYVIYSLKSGKVIDVSGYSIKNRANIQQFKYYGTNNQKWKFIPSDKQDFYQIVSVLSSKCMEPEESDHDGAANVFQDECTPGNIQLWYLKESSFSDHTVRIINKKSGKALDIDSKDIEDGANIQQFNLNQGDNQRWTLWPDDFHGGIQAYAIISYLSGKALDVDGFSQRNGANIQQFKYHGRDNQRWKLIPVKGTWYQIISVNSSKCLDVSDFGSDNGANIKQYECNGSDNQLWQILNEKVSMPVSGR